MIKKIIVTGLLVGFTGVLIWGGVNRTLAKSTDWNSAANSNQRSNHDGLWDLGEGESRSQENGNIRLPEGQSRGTIFSSGGNGGKRGQGGGRGQGREILDEKEVQALYIALEDEVHALTVYHSVIETFGEVEPFVELAEAEQHHIDALIHHFDKHEIPVPENPWDGNIPTFESVQLACQAGVEAEIANLKLYEQVLSMTDDSGLIQVFSNLLQASQESHLPELQACQ